MITIFSAFILASSPDPLCVAAAQRMTAFMIEEAEGTRHQAQIEESIDKAGGIDALAVQIAGTMKPESCAFLISAPDSAVRSLAISALPQRLGD